MEVFRVYLPTSFSLAGKLEQLVNLSNLVNIWVADLQGCPKMVGLDWEVKKKHTTDKAVENNLHSVARKETWI